MSNAKLVKDIQVLFGFANLYQGFINSFFKITATPKLFLRTRLRSTLLLRTRPRSITSIIRIISKTPGVEVKDKGKAVLEAKGIVKSDNRMKVSITRNSMNSLGSNAQATLNQLRDAFIKASILNHFDL